LNNFVVENPIKSKLNFSRELGCAFDIVGKLLTSMILLK
jgi:hypothetical protein